MPKSPDAFRTISEVADWLGIQAHVLRFWESKFTQVKPIKRAGGRRYYRPADMQLLGGIKKLLHEDGLTIKGVQKILREEGMSHVAAMSVSLDDEDGDAKTAVMPTPAPRKVPEPEEAVVLPFEALKETTRAETPPADKDASPPEPNAPASEEVEPQTSVDADTVDDELPPEPSPIAADPETEQQAPIDAEADHTAANKVAEEAPVPAEPVEATNEDLLAVSEADAAEEDSATPELPEEQPTAKTPLDDAQDTAEASDAEPVETAETASESEDEAPEEVEGTPASEEASDAPDKDDVPMAADKPEPVAEEATPEPDAPSEEAIAPLPSFLRKPAAEMPSKDASSQTDADDAEPSDDAPEADTTEQAEPVVEASEPQEPPRPKARDIGMPSVTPEAEIHAESATLTRASRIRRIDAASAAQVKPLLAQLSALRDRMAVRSGGAQPKS